MIAFTKGFLIVSYKWICTFGIKALSIISLIATVVSFAFKDQIYCFASLFCPKFLLPIININMTSIPFPAFAACLVIVVVPAFGVLYNFKRALSYSRLISGTVYSPKEYEQCKKELHDLFLKSDVSILVIHGEDIFTQEFNKAMNPNNKIRVLMASEEISAQRAAMYVKSEKNVKYFLERYSNRLPPFYTDNDIVSLITNIWKEKSKNMDMLFHKLELSNPTLKHKHYDFTPSWRMFLFPNQVFVQSYLFDEDSTQVPMRLYKRGSPQFEPFQIYFETVWNNFSST